MYDYSPFLSDFNVTTLAQNADFSSSVNLFQQIFTDVRFLSSIVLIKGVEPIILSLSERRTVCLYEYQTTALTYAILV